MKTVRIIYLSILSVSGSLVVKGQSYFNNISKTLQTVNAALTAGNSALAKNRALALTGALAGRQNISAAQSKVYGHYIVRLMEEARQISTGSSLAFQKQHYDLFVTYWTEAKAKMKT